MFFALLAALSVVSTPDVGCPDEAAIAARLGALGIVLRDDVAVRVRFSSENGKRSAQIELPDASPRTLEHDGADCSSLADATVALLSVLLDEAPAPPPTPPPSATSPAKPPALRAEAAMLVSAGIVAHFAAGATIGGAWRPVHWASVGLSGDLWPARHHALREGTISVSAWTVALVGCGGKRWGHLAIEGCLLSHGGAYAFSAVGFPIVRPADRALFGAEAAVRGVVSMTKSVGLFVRLGTWIPITQVDVGVRGAGAAFQTTSFGPKGAIGLEVTP